MWEKRGEESEGKIRRGWMDKVEEGGGGRCG